MVTIQSFSCNVPNCCCSLWSNRSSSTCGHQYPGFKATRHTMVKAIQLEYLLRNLFLVKVTKNRGRGFTSVCLLGAVRVVVICLMLMTLKPKFSKSAGNISHWRVWGKVTDCCLYWIFGIWGDRKIVETIFVQVEFHRRSRKSRSTAVGIRCADHATHPLPEKVSTNFAVQVMCRLNF
jgi:hypothetical protein